MSNEIRLIALNEAARTLGLSATMMRTIADRGDLPVLRDSVGRRLFFEQDILRLKEQREAKKKAKANGKLRLRSKE